MDTVSHQSRFERRNIPGETEGWWVGTRVWEEWEQIVGRAVEATLPIACSMQINIPRWAEAKTTEQEFTAAIGAQCAPNLCLNRRYGVENE